MACLSLPGLPAHGGTTWAPISARETFPSRIVVLLSGNDLSWIKCKWVYVWQIIADNTFNDVFQPTLRSMQALSTVIQKASVNNFSGSAVLNLLQSQVMNLSCDCHHSLKLHVFKNSLLISWISFSGT
jgi:hypothetical protein